MTTFEKIQRRTGKKPTSCTCDKCKSQCRIPCTGTPEDMFKIVGAGFGDRVGVIENNYFSKGELGFHDRPIRMIVSDYDKEKGSCTFFTNGLCELHSLGLKPTEGKLSHHSTTAENFNPKKSIAWNVAKEWILLSDKKLNSLLDRYVKK